MSEDKRKYQRYSCSITVEAIQPLLKKVISLYGKGIDISQGGILFYSKAPFKEDSDCTIVFTTEDRKLNRGGKIVRTIEPNPERFPQVGKDDTIYAAEFSRPLSEDELNEILLYQSVNS